MTEYKCTFNWVAVRRGSQFLKAKYSLERARQQATGMIGSRWQPVSDYAPLIYRRTSALRPIAPATATKLPDLDRPCEEFIKFSPKIQLLNTAIGAGTNSQLGGCVPLVRLGDRGYALSAPRMQSLLPNPAPLSEPPATLVATSADTEEFLMKHLMAEDKAVQAKKLAYRPYLIEHSEYYIDRDHVTPDSLLSARSVLV